MSTIGERSSRAAVVVFAVILAVVASVFVAPSTPAKAASAANFDPGFIISDSLFYDSDAMSEAQIQAFLVAKGSVLASFRGDVGSRPREVSSATGNVRCEAFTGGTNLLASTMIHRAQTSCGISAKVILVTLQKEQGLILKSTAPASALDRAMGYACPDTAPCAAYALGFGNQVYMGTIQLMTYKASRFAKQPGVQTIGYHPNTACGSSTVNVRNYATAALYSYTPYQPNAAALGNLYGSGDACSSYGNRNFFVFYSGWFESPIGAINPVGVVDSVQPVPGGVQVSGWAFDPDTTDPIEVHVYTNGVGKAIVANGHRPDVDLAYGGVGVLHGYSATIPVTSGGAQEVCIHAINTGPGVHTFLGCRTVTVPHPPGVIPELGRAPFGVVDRMSTAVGEVTVSGWAIDPDTASSIEVHAYVGNTGVALVADQVRDDVAGVYAGYGSKHGFSATIPAPPGVHSVCVFAINTASGGHTLLQCRNMTVPA
jgi:hypothetical protein